MSNPAPPNVVIIAGPNGAGKSTAAPYVLRDFVGIGEFVNADAIARGLSGFAEESVAFEAGRIMLARLGALAEQRRSFAFETTLASKSFAHRVKQLKMEGYQAHIVFLWVPTPNLSVARVARRVSEGGHHVPEETVRNRYSAGLRNLFRLYLPIMDSWQLLDNTSPENRRVIAEHLLDGEMRIVDAAIWNHLQEQYR